MRMGNTYIDLMICWIYEDLYEGVSYVYFLLRRKIS